ncbi:MAG: alpha/beta hydrolase, partial [Comamonas sp.]|nr:alpha/beta hydrolase [Comamonas sp.]
MTSAVEAACSLAQVSQELGVDVPAAIARLQATAQRVQTRLGEATDSGVMIWHGWQPPQGVAQRGLPLVLLHGGSGIWTHW